MNNQAHEGTHPRGADVLESFSLTPAHSRSAERVRIRPYRETDRDEVRRICCDTGFLGDPIDAIFCDRELFADLLTGVYLDYEPEWALVAEGEGRIVGYLLGSVSERFQRNQVVSGFRTARQMVRRLMTHHYDDHPRSRQYVWWLLLRGGRERPSHPAHAAHLHFNLDGSYRGRTVARRLWVTYEDMLRAEGILHYYGEFYSYPQRRPEQIYARYGFEVFDRRETTLFQPEIEDTVHVVCAEKWLDQNGRSWGGRRKEAS